mmetsp:Transcript_113810/g.179092  ORF Transcript_113810/g.179092 Transcript_113810/m.179092 type:complete len:342 (-) Transcript_113810:84-1109(-)
MFLADASVRGVEAGGNAPAASGIVSLVRTAARRLEVINASEGVQVLILEAAVWTLGWTVLFYVLAWTSPRWMKSFPESTKSYENDRYWLARQTIGILHALLICILSVPGLAVLIVAPENAWFAYSVLSADETELVQCKIDGDYAVWYWYVALSGLAFTTFTLSDVVVSLIHRRSIDPDVSLFVHHAAFIFSGLIIRANCMMPFNASILMSMEVSTPFLNYLFLVRHRGPDYKLSTMICGSMFFLTYIIFRLIINTYGTIVMWMHSMPALLGHSSRDEVVPPAVPSWQIWFLLAAVTAGSVVQFFWFPNIWTMFMKNYRAAFGNGKTSTNDDYEKLPVDNGH